MPVTTGTYSNNEEIIYNTLISVGLNTAAACGILSNLQAEAGFNPTNLQNSYNTSLGYSDAEYTKAVNNGSYKNFINDSAGYGIAQWTYWNRKSALLKYAKSLKTSIGNLDMQIKFLIKELRGEAGYSDFLKIWVMLKDIDNSPQGAYDAAFNFCRDFERPAGGISVYRERANTAMNSYWNYYSKTSLATKSVENIGNKIVEIAKSTIGLSYINGGVMYDTNYKGADDSGLVYYCYTEAGVEIRNSTAEGLYNLYKDKAKSVSKSEIAPADLLFYESSGKVSHVAIANGKGGIIHAKGEVSGIVEENSIDSPDYILRILSSAETIQGVSISSEDIPGVDTEEYAINTSQDNSLIIAQNLSRMKAEGYEYGYLIDITHGGKFEFYIPEFSEQAGAQWSPVDIRGRSVTVQSYESTSSRTINISLDLYAGVGIYAPKSGESGEDTISRLHSDMYFVKSLEYPDYTNVITRPPATVRLILGSAISLEGVVSNVVVEHLKPLDAQNRSMYVKLSFTVTQTAVDPPDWTDIRAGSTSINSTEDIGSILQEDRRDNILNNTGYVDTLKVGGSI